MPVEWTESSTAASSSVTPAVSYVQLGNGHLYFGIVVLFQRGYSIALVVFPAVVFFSDGVSFCHENKDGGRSRG